MTLIGRTESHPPIPSESTETASALITALGRDLPRTLWIVRSGVQSPEAFSPVSASPV
jgi:hypothetical protein